MYGKIIWYYFQQEGYDASNSIQGEHFKTPFETLKIKKNSSNENILWSFDF